MSASMLAPGTERPTIVLFCTEHPSTDALRDAFQRVSWPAGYRVSLVEVGTQPVERRWFPLHEPPVVAVVLDGAVLALEYECSADACRRLVRVAEQQRHRLTEL